MNVRRFTARNSRDALILVRQVLGEDAVVLSTKPSVDGVEVLAMAPEGMQQIERMAATAPETVAPSLPGSHPRHGPRIEPALATDGVAEDVARLSMSTLSFQDYVRERMLRRRQAALAPQARGDGIAPQARTDVAAPQARTDGISPQARTKAVNPPAREAFAAPQARHELFAPQVRSDAGQLDGRHDPMPVPSLGEHASALEQRMGERAPQAAREAQAPARDFAAAARDDAAQAASAVSRRDQEDMMSELRQVKGLIEERFGALAFMEKLNRQPAQARLAQKLLDAGFSPALIRKLGDSLPMDVADETGWAAGVLERNLVTAEHESPLEDQGGVYALVGATGVGKTTTTAKIAAAFAAKYGANNLGLITLDAYRIGAHEQLRAYGRILGVPVHTAHDRASLEDLLDLLAGKKMVLVDTAGMAQRDTRTRELLEMVSHRAIRKLLVVNAASQGETIEDVLLSYAASTCAGIVLSKVDEAVKLGPALDALIRMKLKVIGVANGQRVPEDWHRLSANALVQRSLRAAGGSAYKLDANDVNLIFTAPVGAATPGARGPRPSLHA